MRQLRINIVIALLSSFSIYSFAQQSIIPSQIPQSAIGVLSFNSGVIQKKVKLDEFQGSKAVLKFQEEFFGELLRNYSADSNAMALIGKLDQVGINTSVSSYMYFEYISGVMAITYAFELSDSDEFKTLVNAAFPVDKRVELLLNKGVTGYKLPSGTSAISWNSKIAKFTGVFDSEKSSYYHPYGIEKGLNYDSIADVKEQEQLQELEAFVNESYNLPSSKALASNANFSKFLDLDGDITLWGNNAGFMDISSGDLGSMGMMIMPLMDYMKVLYKGSYVTANMKFTNNGIEADIVNYMGSDLMKYNKQFLKSSFNSSMLNYIPRDYVFCAATTINLEPTMPMMRELIYPMIQEIPNYGQMATDMVDIVDVFIDEEAIYKLVEGDFVLIFNGLQEVEIEESYQKYDDDYNYETITETYTKTIPKMTFMFSTEDEITWKKALNLPLMAPKYDKINEFFVLKESGMEIYFAVENGIGFISTDGDLISKYLRTGLPENLRINGDDKKLFKTYKSIVLAKPMEDTFEDDRDIKQLQEILKKMQVRSALYTSGTIKKNTLKSHAEFKFGDGKQNIVNFVAQLADQMMKEYEDKRTEREALFLEGIAVPESTDDASQAVEDAVSEE